MKFTAIVIFRDRVSYAQRCVRRLVDFGLDVHIVDHTSTYPPAIEWLMSCGLPVHRLPNAHPRTLWEWEDLGRVVGSGPYVVTDCDVVPDDNCPLDWPVYAYELLVRYPERVKVGMGLRVDDIPRHYVHANDVRRWETMHISHPVAPGIYGAAVDTTLAMHVPLRREPRFALGPALRTDAPYLARHLTWYQDTDHPSEEDLYYAAHALRGASHWLDPRAWM